VRGKRTLRCEEDEDGWRDGGDSEVAGWTCKVVDLAVEQAGAKSATLRSRLAKVSRCARRGVQR